VASCNVPRLKEYKDHMIVDNTMNLPIVKVRHHKLVSYNYSKPI